ncbi:MAG TPA: DUF86 domain-containing protein [bacterium]
MNRDRTLLLHILDAIDAVEMYAADGKARFMDDRRTQDAIARNLVIVGEAVKHLSGELTAQYPDISWRQIAGLRDRLIHQYFQVSLPLVWTIASVELPVLRGQIQHMLDDLEAEQPTP